MVGAAQYHDDEIGWVLSAVVGKKKQSYIQIHFKEKFGRTLNHNQIRYIKNKYGRDPRFNSPLVNIRPPMAVTSPKPDSLSELGDKGEQGKEIDFGSQKEAGPSTLGGEVPDRPEDENMVATQSKRKRSVHDPGDVLERLIKQTTKSQRLDLQLRQAVTPELAPGDDVLEPLPQWNVVDPQLPVSHTHTHTTLSTPVASLADNCHNPLYAGVYDSTQQSQLMQFHGTSTGIGWTPSVSLSGYSWGTRDSPMFTSISGSANTSALMQPSPVMMAQYHPAEDTQELLQTPTAAQNRLQLPPSRLAALPVSQISPPMPTCNIASSPYSRHQGPQNQQLAQQEQQQLLSYIQPPGTPALPNSAVSQMERHPYRDYVPGESCQPAPNFQQIPIEPASSELAIELSAFAGEGIGENYGDWAQVAGPSPHDFSPFGSFPVPVDFPFQNVKYTGLTAASSQAIRQSLLSHPDIHNSGLSAQRQHRLAPQPSPEHLNFGTTTTLELLSMIHRPAFNTAAMPHPQPSYPVYPSTLTFSPPITQAQSQSQAYQNCATLGPQDDYLHGTVNEFAGTIDPRLLIDHQSGHLISPHPHPSTSPLNAVKHEMEPPPAA
ncbi:hypothetical protein V8C37DRAFT_193355 [Trichoderma ceciliae]